MSNNITKNDYNELIKKYPRKIKWALKKIEKGYPVQYLIGNVSFYGYPILVNKKVLIPRFETEQLIEKTLKKLDFNPKNIVDLGTGSGCIAITLKKLFPFANVTGLDISRGALKVAKKNAKANKLSILFKKGNIQKPIIGTYDLIISNPPYISFEEKIEEKVFNYEPHVALFASNNGLDFYEKILKNIQKSIGKKGLIAFEIGQTQKEPIFKLAQYYFPNSTIFCEKDYNNKDRFIFIKLNK